MSIQKEEKILEFIKDYINTNHISPSVREIREGVGIQSTSTIHRYLHRLEAKQEIQMLPGKNRSIVISERPVKAIPLVRPEHLGEMTNEHIIEYISYTPEKSGEAPLFAVRAERDFLKAGIAEQDILIAERSEQYEERKYILFLDSEQRLSVTNQEIPEHPLGTLVALIRNF